MLTRCIALFVLFSVVAVRGQEGTKAATYTRDLEQESVNGRCVGVTDGDTINVLILGKQQIKVRLAFVDAPERGQAKAWAYPVVANGRLYIRDLGTLWCYDIRAVKAAP